MRARNIKPGFFLNCELSDIDFASRLLFIGLWCYADREGRFEWKPKQIKATIFPYDNVNIEKLLCNLMSLRFITRNDTTGYIPHFKEHQHPHPNEAKSRLPENPNKNNVIARDTNVIALQADIRIEDTMIPDIRIEDIKAIVVPVKPSRPSAKKTDEEWLEEIKANSAYQDLNFEVEIGKAQAWCMTKGRKCSRAFLLNWFNRADKNTTLKGLATLPLSYAELRDIKNKEALRQWAEGEI